MLNNVNDYYLNASNFNQLSDNKGMASFSIIINASPVCHHAHHAAYEFAKAAQRLGHSIVQIFFFQDGVATGSALLSPAGNESNWGDKWRQFKSEGEKRQQQAPELVLCVASALRRGIVDEEEASQQNLSANLHADFRLGGLGELVTVSLRVDRVVHFK